MKPKINREGIIMNTENLTVDQVVGRRAFCPACGQKDFKMWPEGWDGHAGYKCEGLDSDDVKERKAEFKSRFRYLFR